MNTPSLSLISLVAAGVAHATPQPDFHLPEINDNTDRAGQLISPRDYRGFVSVYYFGHETWSICRAQFATMQIIDDAIRGQTDLPVRFIGIQEQNVGFSSTMFDGKTMTWLREENGNEPSNSWSVPIPSRPSQEVYYRDAIILDHNNEFVTVQNLTSEPISSSQANLDKFVASILSAATTEDTDNDHLPDHWERDHFDNLDATANTPAPNNLPALVAFATGGVPAPFTLSRDAGRPYTFTFRNRIGNAASSLIYQLQTSTDNGKTWTFNGSSWSPVDAYTPYDGTATRINRFTYTPSTTPGTDTLFRLYVATQP